MNNQYCCLFRILLILICLVYIFSAPMTYVDMYSPAALEAAENTETESLGQSGAEPDSAIGFSDAAEAELFSSSLASNERVVTSYSELKDALANDNGVNTVYFGADITMQSTGIRINPAKTKVTVDGFNPLDPGQTEPYTLTDYSSYLFTDTIYVNASGVVSLLVRDLNITGKNYYGPFSVQETSATDALTVTYQRVSYNGPQIGYHRRGALRFIDCDISIHGGNGGSSTNEVAEAKYISFEGDNVITSVTGSTSVFWQPAGGTFDIADGSSLTLSALQMGGTYGMYYADGYGIDIAVGEGAVFDAAISGSVNVYAQASLSSLTINEYGGFRLKTTASATRDVMSLGGGLTVKQGASFILNGYGGASYSLLAQRSGNILVEKDAVFQLVAGNTYSTLLGLYGGSLSCGDPAGVLLYNTGGRDIQAVNSPATLYISAEQVNYWKAAGTGGLDDPPLYRWKKADDSNFVVSGTIAAGTGGNFSTLSSNYEGGDLPGIAPDSETFSMTAARVLAFGRLELTVEIPTTTSTEIIGYTSPGTVSRASFTQEGSSVILPGVTVGRGGCISIPLDVSLAEGTEVTVACSFQFLRAASSVFVGTEGSVSFTVPDELIFVRTHLASKTQLVKRADSGWSVTVSDSRGAGGAWRLYVRAPQPLTLSDPTGAALPDSLVFIDSGGVSTPLDAADTLLVYAHTTASNNESTTIQWAENRGLLASIPPGGALAGSYTGNLEWILADTP